MKKKCTITVLEMKDKHDYLKVFAIYYFILVIRRNKDIYLMPYNWNTCCIIYTNIKIKPQEIAKLTTFRHFYEHDCSLRITKSTYNLPRNPINRNKS